MKDNGLVGELFFFFLKWQKVAKQRSTDLNQTEFEWGQTHMVQRWRPNSRAIVCKIPQSLLSWQCCVLEAELPHNRRDSHHTACRVELLHCQNAASNTQIPITASQRGELMQNTAVFPFFLLNYRWCRVGDVAWRLRDGTRRVPVHTLKQTEKCDHWGASQTPQGNLPFSVHLHVWIWVKANVLVVFVPCYVHILFTDNEGILSGHY